MFPLPLFFFLFFFLAASGLSCGTRDLRCSTRDLSLCCTGSSLVVAHGLLSSCAVLVFLFSSCVVWAPERVGSVVCGTRAF